MLRDKVFFNNNFSGMIERVVPQAYFCARASSATPRSVHVLGLFLCISISRRESHRYQAGLDTSLIRIQTRTPLSPSPPYDYSKFFTARLCRGGRANLSAPKSQQFLRFAIAMPITDPRNRAISETRESNAALRFKGAMESR